MFDTGTAAVTATLTIDDDCKKSSGKKVKPERNLWREDEILTLLRIFRDNNYVELLSDKTTKSENVFRGLVDKMSKFGYSKKNYQQIWTKWKFLKSTYMTSRRANVIPKVITTKTYLALDNLLSGVFNSHQNYSDGESFYDNGSRYDSEVSSICSNTNNNSISVTNNNNVSSGFGMQHPIFGDMTDRLEDDYVKSEPLDIDEFNQQMQEEEDERVIVEDDDNDEENCINANNKRPTINSAMNALGMMPVTTEFSPTKVVEPVIQISPKTQVPRLKTVPLRKINLKQPQQPIPIAPVHTVSNLPKLLPKPAPNFASTPIINNLQKLPKLKLIKQKSPVLTNNHSTARLEYERRLERSFEDEPPTKAPKTQEDSSASGSNTPTNKSKSYEMVKDMQKDLIAEFFKKQQELVKEEYEFQRKQDEMLLKSFEEQNRMLLTAAKNLIEQIPSNFYL